MGGGSTLRQFIESARQRKVSSETPEAVEVRVRGGDSANVSLQQRSAPLEPFVVVLVGPGVSPHRFLVPRGPACISGFVTTILQ